MNNRTPVIFKHDGEVVAVLPTGDELYLKADQNVPSGTLAGELSL